MPPSCPSAITFGILDVASPNGISELLQASGPNARLLDG